MNDRSDSDILPARTRRWARVGDAWLEASIECSAGTSDLFDLALTLRAADGPLVTPALQERYAGVSLQPSHPQYAPAVIAGSEIAYVVGLLAAGEPAPVEPAAPPAVARARRRFRLPSLALRPHRLAAVFALLGLLFPGVAFVSASARADGGGTVTGPPVVTTPTTPTTESTPTDTTATSATDTTSTATVTDTTSSGTTPTDTTGDTSDVLPARDHPPEVKPPTQDTTPPTTTITATLAKPVKARAVPKVKPKAPAKAPKAAPTTLTIPGGAFDPTPPGLRLSAAFAADLTAVAANAHVGWAQLLGLIRAQGHYSRTPATEPALEALAVRMGGAASTAYPQATALSLLGNPDLAARAVALSNYYEAVGLPALVHGLKWAKPALERRLLADPRALIYPGGRNDVQSGRVDVRVLAVIEYLAQTYGEVRVSCLITGHSLYARPGVISAHAYGLAVDIAAVKNIPIAGHQRQGGITESAIESILMLPPEMQPNQVISLLNLGGPSFALANHWDHIHIGFAPAPFVIARGEKDSLATLNGAGSLLQLWQSAGATYGVPWQVLAAINKIESNFGKNMGPSSAGAIGWMQFLPSTWRKWGLDANGDGIANPWEPADAIYSAARYLGAAGAQTNLPRAIYSYNHAQWYVDEVLQLASLYGNQGAGTFAGLYAPMMFSDDASTLQQRNLALRQDSPMSLSTQWRLGRQRAAEPDLIGRWLSVFTNLVGTAQQAMPEPVVGWLRQGGSLLEAMAAQPAAATSAYDLRFRQTMDPAILSRLMTG